MLVVYRLIEPACLWHVCWYHPALMLWLWEPCPPPSLVTRLAPVQEKVTTHQKYQDHAKFKCWFNLMTLNGKFNSCKHNLSTCWLHMVDIKNNKVAVTHLHNNIFWFLLFKEGRFKISLTRKCWSKAIEYLLHLVETLPQILIKICFHSGHYPLQLDPFIQQLPVVLNVDKQDNTQKSVDLVRLMSRAKQSMRVFSMNDTKD